MVIVTFAVPQESSEFRRALRTAGGRLGGEEIRVNHLGIGPASAASRFAPLLAETPRLVICAGFAGALDPRLKAGDLVLADNFSTPALLDRARRFSGATTFIGPLVTVTAPAETVEAKSALARESGALALDMETAPIAEACRAAAVPLLAVRAISDDRSTPLPVPYAEWFDAERQRPRPWRLVRFLLLRPGSIGPFVHFLRDLHAARSALSDLLRHSLDDHR